MRTTLHLVSASDYLAYAGIYRQSRIAELQRQLAALGEDADFAEDGVRLAAFARSSRASRPELLALLGRPKLRIEERRRGSSGTGSPPMPGSSTALRRRSGASTRPAARSFPREPGSARTARTGDAAAANLVRRYLAALRAGEPPGHRAVDGPTARSARRPGLERLELRRFRDELGRELFDLPRAPAPPADTPCARAAPPAVRQPRAEPRRSAPRRRGRAPRRR